MVMRKSIFFILSLACVLLASCGTGRYDVFLGDVVTDTTYTMYRKYSLAIHTGDKLYIHVDSESPETILAFNQETNKLLNTVHSNTNQQNSTSATIVNRNTKEYGVDGYLVNQHGIISFPQLGNIVVAGLTHDSLSSLLQRRLREEGFVEDAVVTVRLMAFRVSVVGEVLHPTEAYADGNRLTILEALAQAGDVSFYGRRDNICVVRDAGHGVTLGMVDLTKSESLESPYYYLQPDDIIYVEPNDRRKREFYDTETLSEINRYAQLIRQATEAVRRLQDASHHLNDNRKKN